MGNVKKNFQIPALLIFFVLTSFTSNNTGVINSVNFFSELDPETANWLSRVDSAGGTVSADVIEAVDDYVKEIKGLKFQSMNIRNLILRENWYCGNFNAAFVPIFRNFNGSSQILGTYKDINRNYSSGSFTDTGEFSGLKGNGVNRYHETGINPFLINELNVNDIHFMIYSMTDSVDAGRLGSRGFTGNGLYMYPKYIDGNTHFNISGPTESKVYMPSGSGYILVQRKSADQVGAFYNNTFINSLPNNSALKVSEPVIIGAFNNFGTVIHHLSMRLGGYSIGKSFTLAQQKVHYNAVQRLMNRLGRDQMYSNEPGFRSKLFTFTGNKLVINYETRPGGFLQFELQDQSGIPVENYSINDCPQITGNEFSREVTWNSGSDLSAFVNTPVYLKIRMKNSDLYSMQFKNEIVITDSSQNGFKAGAYKQFFPDTLLFGNNLPVIRKMHSPFKNPDPIISPTMPWETNRLVTTYSNVGYSLSIFTGEMVYKMWLRALTPTGRAPVYFESVDGINWTRPNLESYKFNGDMNNNIMNDNPVYPSGLYTVVEDSARSVNNLARRYKSVYNTHHGLDDSYLNVSFSADGLTWIPYSGNPVRLAGEDLSSSGWNPVLGKYLGYFRDSLAIRKIGRYLSDDWINWTYTGTILIPDALDQKTTGYYNMQVLFKDSVYWGFLDHFQMNFNGDESPAIPSRTDNTVFIELLFSRDGINFVRCGGRQPFLDISELGKWDDQMIYTAGVPVQRGNEYYIYYNGFNYKHMNPLPPPADGGPVKSQIGLAKIGVDRFVSLTAF
jgi:hypothetical protein